jgi:hypothetical protein
MILLLCIVLVAGLIAGGEAQTGRGFMNDLGYPEPDWVLIRQSEWNQSVFTIDDTTQVWGTVKPFTGGGSVCKYDPVGNGGRGTCKTDVSWLHSAIGMTKDIFKDPLANYIFRFQVHGACYRSTQVRAHDCVPPSR